MLRRVIKSTQFAVKLSQAAALTYFGYDIYNGNISSLALLIASLYIEKCTAGTMRHIANFIYPPYLGKDWHSLNAYERLCDITSSCLALNGIDYEHRVHAAAACEHIALNIEINYSAFSRLLPEKFPAVALLEVVDWVRTELKIASTLSALEKNSYPDNTTLQLKLTTPDHLIRLIAAFENNTIPYHLNLNYDVSEFRHSESARRQIENSLSEIKKRDDVITDTIACATLQECNADQTSFVSELPKDILNVIYNYAKPKNIVNVEDFINIVSTVKHVSFFKPRVVRAIVDVDGNGKEFILSAGNRP